MEVVNINNDRGVISIPRLKPRALITPGSLLIHYIMADEYSNVILFYCFANKLIAVKEKINNMMSNDNIYQTLPLNNALLNFLQKMKMLSGPLSKHNGSLILGLLMSQIT